MKMRSTVLALITLAVANDAAAQRRAVTIDDQFAVQDVGSPELSPDGNWVAYTVATWDVAADKRNTDLWKVRYDGTGTDATDVLDRERDIAEVESRRQVPGVPVVAARAREGQPGVAARERRR